MNLYLVQHAEAKTEEQDPDRSLTPKGRNDAIQVAETGKGLDLKIDQIRHSGKKRARQTAGIFGQHLSPKEGIVEASGLGPVDDVKPVGDEVTAGNKNLLLVGHLPFMERITGYLITGDPDHKVIDFHNAGLVCLKRDREAWLVDWIITPEIGA
ncbi:MAG: phosphohistidine phosphatase SixA [Anaerolineales bacterium]|nr:phosphohistidine phosphatase SixA [Anaerolineales bacterium]